MLGVARFTSGLKYQGSRKKTLYPTEILSIPGERGLLYRVIDVRCPVFMLDVRYLMSSDINGKIFNVMSFI